MPAPEAVNPARAVREMQGTLEAPALRSALALEDALAGVLATLVWAPLAATFDPLARPAPVASPPRASGARGRTGRQGRALVPGMAPAATARAKADPASAPAAGIGAALGGAPATDADRTSGVLGGIVAALTGSLREAPATPARTSPAARGAVLAAASMTGAASRAGGRALEALPGGSAVAPVLGEIGALADALWWRVALTPPAAEADPPLTPGAAPSRSPLRPPVGAPAAHDAGAGPAVASLPAQAQATLATLGEIVVALYGQAAGAGAPHAAPGERAAPAPRAPSVLVGPGGAGVPVRPEASTLPVTPDPAGATTPAGAPGVCVTVDADALARALRAEGALRGVDLP